MTAGRLYCIQSWNNASETSGEQIGNRLADSRGLHFDRLGNANLSLYADAVVEKKSKVNIKDRILPQAVRLDKLTNDLIELEQEYKQGKMSTDEYSMYRAVAITRRDRAWILYCKAVGISPTDTDQNNSDSVQVKGETAFNIDDVQASSLRQSTTDDNSFVASIPDGNIFKGVVEKACKLSKTAVRWSQKAKSYWNELKAV